MKINPPPARRKTSVTLPQDLLKDVNEMSKEYKNRSQFIETVLRAFITKRKREQREARDLAIINENADRLNAETADLLAFVGELYYETE